MPSVVPSAATLNARLTAEKVALEEALREARLEKRGLEAQNAKLTDQVSGLMEVRAELQSHLKRLLAGRVGQAADERQGYLFAFGLSSAIEDLMAPALANGGVAHLDADDASVPDAERESDKPTKKQRSRTRRKVDEANLHREVRRSELPPEERFCPETGIELVEVGVKVTTELDYRSAEMRVIEHHPVLYGPPPEVAKERKIGTISAPLPPVAVEGVTASAALLAWMLCQKYVLHLPLYRQEDAFARLGVRLSRKTLCDWVLKCAFALAPIARELERQIRAGPVLQLDDTRT